MEKVNAKELRARARARLKGNWGNSILIVLIYVIIAKVGEEIISKYTGTIIGWAFGIIIGFPLLFGMWKHFLDLSKGKSSGVATIFDMFKGKSWIQVIIVQVVFIIGAIITLLPIIALLVSIYVIQMHQVGGVHTHASHLAFNSPMIIATIIGLIIGIGIYVLLFIPFIIYAYTYSQVIFITLSCDGSFDVRRIFKRSRHIMRDNKWRLFRLQISYIGWYVLGLIALAFGIIWSVSYILAGLAEFYKQVSYEYDNGVESEK